MLQLEQWPDGWGNGFPAQGAQLKTIEWFQGQLSLLSFQGESNE